MNRLLVFFLFLLLGCGANEKPNEIQLFNGYALVLKPGESVAEIDEVVNKHYTEAQKNSSFQIPLFRYISHKDYEMFVGVPYDTSFDDIAAYYRQQVNAEGSSVECDSIQCCLMEKNADHATCQCVFKKENNSLVLILLKSRAAASPSTDVMNASGLAARLIKQ